MSALPQATDGRYVVNQLDLSRRVVQDDEQFKSTISTYNSSLSARLAQVWLDDDKISKDTSIYTGALGALLAQFKLAWASECEEFVRAKNTLLEKTDQAVRKAQQRRAHETLDMSFIIGTPGYFLVHALCSDDDRQAYINAYLDQAEHFINQTEARELLNGTAGYLYGLLLLLRCNGPNTVPAHLLFKVTQSLIAAGQHRGFQGLMYTWKDEFYLGGAHGLSGILMQLLQAIEALQSHSQSNAEWEPHMRQWRELIRESIGFILSCQLPSGNIPSAPERERDELVQWCHGSVGVVPLLCLASKIYRDNSLLERAETFAAPVWERGLLLKGTGLCHGIAGNSYVFLSMYRYTGDVAWLHKARAFALFAAEHVHELSTPDHPWSLFEGRAGELCFMHDCMDPLHSWFPVYELPPA